MLYLKILILRMQFDLFTCYITNLDIKVMLLPGAVSGLMYLC